MYKGDCDNIHSYFYTSSCHKISCYWRVNSTDKHKHSTSIHSIWKTTYCFYFISTCIYISFISYFNIY